MWFRLCACDNAVATVEAPTVVDAEEISPDRPIKIEHGDSSNMSDESESTPDSSYQSTSNDQPYPPSSSNSGVGTSHISFVGVNAAYVPLDPHDPDSFLVPTWSLRCMSERIETRSNSRGHRNGRKKKKATSVAAQMEASRKIVEQQRILRELHGSPLQRTETRRFSMVNTGPPGVGSSDGSTSSAPETLLRQSASTEQVTEVQKTQLSNLNPESRLLQKTDSAKETPERASQSVMLEKDADRSAQSQQNVIYPVHHEGSRGSSGISSPDITPAPALQDWHPSSTQSPRFGSATGYSGVTSNSSGGHGGFPHMSEPQEG
eukprot:CAMPEP_0117676070 /NCGR_PEP_ID=MMETSP0804-20121206/15954_1 /TAXON_ID=1074897 /ORGANISM="Tetraselmis astigmatica, Strain CCMP880" /LENGTH=318 /DNA_ID=CAMNT_0005485139 /DNA_START=1 /DNA_END=957 /DNA_ORIENTATION=+